jgi:predicted PurR-regulated permease PerM
MVESSTRKYFYATLFIGGSVLTAFILWPFAKVLILSAALSTVLFPLYTFFDRHIKSSWVAALFTILIFITVLCIPLFTVGTIVFKQSQHLYTWVIDHGGLDNITQLFNRSISNLFPGGAINLKDSVAAVTGKFTASIGEVFTATLTMLFSFLLIILSMFYFLKEGTKWKNIILHFSPLSDESGNKILDKLHIAVNGIIKGYLLIAVVQGVLMGLGLLIFGVPNAALWGVLTAVASLIPTVGTALVSVPAVLFLFILGKNGAAIGLAIWAGALVGTIDNMLSPLFVGKKIAIHPLLVLFSVLGGIALMGPIGILVGPLVISFMYALASVYKTETLI